MQLDEPLNLQFKVIKDIGGLEVYNNYKLTGY